MTEPPNEEGAFEHRTYEVFNQRRTIGVLAAHGGAVRGIFLDEEVRKMTERALAQEVLAVASVASARGRLSLREQLDAAIDDRRFRPTIYELMPEVPTAEEYEAFRHKTLKY
ncbi:hypothetical protein [Mycobacterium riyadhense]|uniref:Uncharacterized protein n=1 Tax=Mycobacterium riyadhense TaxID=486698 RepID=A0A1X2CUJ5_9MYCO|nr:hypothetical protein [Mycobacterium riyadhense]MCV7145575.1 hypothetical protein [Mycobacterium riyadhense]ORW79563.1 hypothetical protein AWC22_18685 [Mycobacterium riyadhense]VTP00728.1 hypothetical protein BIN_B_03684 [Mycobacterium riyadhense]